jgi:hypothetical protein
MPLPWPSATSVHPGVPLGDHPHPRESVRPKSQSQMPTPPYDDSAGFRPPRAQKAQHLSVAAMLNPPHSPTAPITPVSVSPSPPHRA